MTAEKLILECSRRGILLAPRGHLLDVTPEQPPTPELVEQLRRHKFEIIAILESKRKAAWLHVAYQVLCGEFVGCNSSTRKILTTGLRAVRHQRCQKALKVLTK
jgi:hypothetical protein